MDEISELNSWEKTLSLNYLQGRTKKLGHGTQWSSQAMEDVQGANASSVMDVQGGTWQPIYYGFLRNPIPRSFPSYSLQGEKGNQEEPSLN